MSHMTYRCDLLYMLSLSRSVCLFRFVHKVHAPPNILICQSVMHYDRSFLTFHFITVFVHIQVGVKIFHVIIHNLGVYGLIFSVTEASTVKCTEK